MADPTGFKRFERRLPTTRPVDKRVQDYREIYEPFAEELVREQAARCQDCGIPLCQGSRGCPVNNPIPDANDAVWRGQWREACELWHSTCNFPEITGRICPAFCEVGCTLAAHLQPVTIRQLELESAERGWKEGWIEPQPPAERSGARVAIIGSGPAGLAAAQQLNRRGHNVIVFEKDPRIGGMLRYGIPDFKLEKWVVDRRLQQMVDEGVVLEPEVEVGVDLSFKYLRTRFDAVLVACGAQQPRDLPIPGRELDGVHFAMSFLTQQNRRNHGETFAPEREILATGKNVVVIGGGDTGSDCIGTARRQGAKSITQFEILPQPPKDRPFEVPWPHFIRLFKVSSSQEEGVEIRWSTMTKTFEGDNGRVQRLQGCQVEWKPGPDGRPQLEELPGSKFELEAELVLLAMGFVGPVHSPLLEEMGVAFDERQNVKVNADGMTSIRRIFAAGDASLGASTVVQAIHSGRVAAAGIDRFLRHH